MKSNRCPATFLLLSSLTSIPAQQRSSYKGPTRHQDPHGVLLHAPHKAHSSTQGLPKNVLPVPQASRVLMDQWTPPINDCSPEICPTSTHKCLANPNHPQHTTDDTCSPCQAAQTYWPCDVSNLCYCWNTSNGESHIPPAPSTKSKLQGGGLDNNSHGNYQWNSSAIDPCQILTEDIYKTLSPMAQNPYTYQGFCNAVKEYNINHPTEGIFNMGNEENQRAELAAFFGNALHESDEFQAAREYLACADQIIQNEEVYCKPCDVSAFDWDARTCSVSLASEGRAYNSYCQSNLLPPDGCECDNVYEVSPWNGTNPDLAGYVPANKVYFGRGSIQLSWNYNYIRASIALTGAPQTFCQRPDLVATKEEYAWGAGIFYWMENVKNDKSCHQSVLLNSDFGETLDNINGGLECPADETGWHGKAVQLRLNRYCRAATALGVVRLLKLDGCMDMDKRMDQCLQEGNCEDCQVWVGKIGLLENTENDSSNSSNEQHSQQQVDGGELSTFMPTTSPTKLYTSHGPCSGEPCRLPADIENKSNSTVPFCRNSDGICGKGPEFCNAHSTWTNFCHNCDIDSQYGCPNFGCSHCSGESQVCVGNLNGLNPISDEDCAPCSEGQPYWPCDIKGAEGCWCYDTNLPRVEPAPPSGLEVNNVSSNTSFTSIGQGVCDVIINEAIFESLAPNAAPPFTYRGFCESIDQYNAHHAEKVFLMGTHQHRLSELAAFLGIASHETNGFMASREYLACGDNVEVDGVLYCKPCTADQYNYDTHTCSVSMLAGDQSYMNFCQPYTTPPNGCQCEYIKEVEASGPLEGYMKANDVFFGRGSIQLSHNFNYIRASATMTGNEIFCAQPELLASVESYSWGVGLYLWMDRMNEEGITSHVGVLTDGDFGIALDIINGGNECPVKKDDSFYSEAIKSRVDHYCHAAQVLGATELLGFSGCDGLEKVYSSCMVDGTCPRCNYWDPSRIHTAAPTELSTSSESQALSHLNTMTEDINLDMASTVAGTLPTNFHRPDGVIEKTSTSSTLSTATVASTSTQLLPKHLHDAPSPKASRIPSKFPAKLHTKHPSKLPTKLPTEVPTEELITSTITVQEKVPDQAVANDFAELIATNIPKPPDVTTDESNGRTKADSFALSSHSKGRDPKNPTEVAHRGDEPVKSVTSVSNKKSPDLASPDVITTDLLTDSPTISPTIMRGKMTNWALTPLQDSLKDDKEEHSPTTTPTLWPEKIVDVADVFRPESKTEPAIIPKDMPTHHLTTAPVSKLVEVTAESLNSPEDKLKDDQLKQPDVFRPDSRHFSQVGANSFLFTPSDDATISSSHPKANFGMGSVLTVNKINGDAAIFRFDLTAIGNNKVIKNAVLRLTTLHPDRSITSLYYLEPTLPDWQEDSVTFSTLSLRNKTSFTSVAKDRDENHVEIDVSSVISSLNVSFMLSGGDADGIEFYSKQSDQSSYIPMLLVKLSPDAADKEPLGPVSSEIKHDKDTYDSLGGPNESLTGSITGHIWLDKNEDGSINADELGLRGLLVDLFRCDGNEWIESMRTAAAGDYDFDGLELGNYYVVVTLEKSFEFTVSTADSNVNASGFGECINISSMQLTSSVNAGVIKSVSPAAALQATNLDATLVQSGEELPYNCQGQPCIEGDGTWCRSKQNFCGKGEAYCNLDSKWKPECGILSPTGQPIISLVAERPNQCSGDPCDEGDGTWCRSEVGFCGNGDLYCNPTSIWIPECVVQTPDITLSQLASLLTSPPSKRDSITKPSEMPTKSGIVGTALPSISPTKSYLQFSSFALPTLTQIAPGKVVQDVTPRVYSRASMMDGETTDLNDSNNENRGNDQPVSTINTAWTIKVSSLNSQRSIGINSSPYKFLIYCTAFIPGIFQLFLNH